MPLFPRNPNSSRRARPAPRPEDRLDFFAVIKGALVGMVVILFVLGFAARGLYGAMLPDSAQAQIDQATLIGQEAQQAQKEAGDARRAAEEAKKSGAPEAADKDSAAQAAETRSKEAVQRANEAGDRAFDAIPGNVRLSVGLLILVLTLGAAAGGGYFAARSTRGRRAAVHASMAGAILVIFGQPFHAFLVGRTVSVSPLILVLNFAGLAGGGWLGGWLYVKQKGPWDGTMPARRSSLFAPRPGPTEAETEPQVRTVAATPAVPGPSVRDFLFGRRRRPTESGPHEDLDDPVDQVSPGDEATVIDVSEMPEPESVDGARQFGPRGRRPRKRTRPASSAGDDDDIE